MNPDWSRVLQDPVALWSIGTGVSYALIDTLAGAWNKERYKAVATLLATYLVAAAAAVGYRGAEPRELRADAPVVVVLLDRVGGGPDQQQRPVDEEVALPHRLVCELPPLAGSGLLASHLVRARLNGRWVGDPTHGYAWNEFMQETRLPRAAGGSWYALPESFQPERAPWD